MSSPPFVLRDSRASQTRARVKITQCETKGHASRLAFLAWGDFHARSRFAHFTIHEEKWGTTLSLSCTNTNLRVSNKFIAIQFRINPVRFCFATFKQCCQKAAQFTLLLIHDQYHDSFFLGRDR